MLQPEGGPASCRQRSWGNVGPGESPADPVTHSSKLVFKVESEVGGSERGPLARSDRAQAGACAVPSPGRPPADPQLSVAGGWTTSGARFADCRVDLSNNERIHVKR